MLKSARQLFVRDFQFAPQENLKSRLTGIPAVLLSDRAALILVFVVMSAAKLVWVSYAEGPIVLGDEYIYSSLARSIASGTGFTVGGIPAPATAPAYPLVLAPAFFFGSDWYRWMLVINVFLSSSSIFPVWWIARQFLPRTLTWVCVWLSMLLPYHVIFPRLLMSENLFVTLFLGSVGCVFSGLDRVPWRRGLFTGAIWGVTYLTRFIFFSVVPILLLLWWIRPAAEGKLELWANARQKLQVLLWAVLGFVLLAAPWQMLTPFRDPAQATSSAVPGYLRLLMDKVLAGWSEIPVVWLCLFAAYLLLMTAPFLPMLVLMPRSIRKMAPQGQFFLLVCVTVTAALFFTSVLFMSSVANPLAGSNMEGRYLLPLLPLFQIFSFVVLEHTIHDLAANRRRAAILTAGITVGLVSLGYYVLIIRGVWSLPAWFANLPWVAPDATAFNASLGGWNGGFLAFYLVLLLVSTMLIVMRPRKWVWTVLVATSIFYLADSFYLAKRMMIGQEQTRHGKVLAELFSPQAQNRPVLIALDNNVPITPRFLASSLVFWNVPTNRFSVRTVSSAEFESLPDSGFAITQVEYANPVRTYQVGAEYYWIYPLPISTLR